MNTPDPTPFETFKHILIILFALAALLALVAAHSRISFYLLP